MLRTREIPVAFTEEELERLDALASAEGGSIAEFIRACVFGPQQEGAATMLARLEGEYIRTRKWHHECGNGHAPLCVLCKEKPGP